MSHTNKQPTGQKKIVVRVNLHKINFAKTGKALLVAPKNAFIRLMNARLRYRFIAATFIIILAEIYTVLTPLYQNDAYALGNRDSLLSEVSPEMAAKIKYDHSQQSFNFNQDPTTDSGAVGAKSYATASAHKDPTKGVTVTDSKNKVDFTMVPKFKLLSGRQDQNRIIYPLADGSGWAVYTMQGIGVKEDIILNYAHSDTTKYSYTLNMGNALKAKIEPDGSLGIYGNTLLSGNVSTATEKDAELLMKARKNAPKDTLLFVIPKPVVLDDHGPADGIAASYSLDGNELTVTATGMKKGKYPLSIDPSIYVVTAAQFMAGNNETNVNFDVSNKLIKKGRTTGARFDEWNPTTDLSRKEWGGQTVPAGGYVYNIGGTSYNGELFNSQGADTFTVPAGVTSITAKLWGGGGGGGGGGASGLGGRGGGGGAITATFAVTPGEVLNVYVGGGGSGGAWNNGGADAGGGGGGGGASTLYRSTTPLAFAGGGGGGGGSRNATTGAAAGPGGCTTVATSCNGVTVSGGGGGGGALNSAGGAAGTGTNPATAGTPLTGGAGANGRSNAGADGSGAAGGLALGGYGGSPNSNANAYAGGGGGGSGYYGGGGGGGSANTNGQTGGGGGGGSNYNDGGASGVTNYIGSTSTTAPGNSADTDRAGAGDGGAGAAAHGSGTAGDIGIVSITYSGGGSSTSTAVNWAQFNTGTGTIDSPNPGQGACSGWCTSNAYALPDGRANYSLVAYNGFLYTMGGTSANCTVGNGTGTSGYCDTVYIAKLGANGEPRLWHPTDSNPNNWVYWYRDTDLPTERAYSGAVAYNNRMYFMGGRTSAGVTTAVHIADVTPNGKLGTWTSSGNTLPSANQFDPSVQVYNDRLYVIGGASSTTAAPTNTTQYSKINSNGTINAWVQTTSFNTGRRGGGTNISVVWGAYIYISGGCTAFNGSGYCTTVASDSQVASINADGSLDNWNNMAGLSDTRFSHSMIAWRDNIYELGGCSAQNTTTGDCDSNMLSTINYGVVNPDGDASTVEQSVASGTAPCSGGSPHSCNSPSASVGNVLNATVITNGYLYIMGGCTNNACTTVSTGITYQAIASDGTLGKPATCSGSYTDSYCISSTALPTGLAATGTTVFNGRIYLVGGFSTGTNVYYVSTNNDGSIGTWASADLSTIGAPNVVTYAYAYARANPVSAGSVPGNLYIIGGCTDGTVGCSNYSNSVVKCNISTAGVPSGCTPSGQLQMQNVFVGATNCGAGLGAMVGTVYANYIYLMGGLTPSCTDLKSTRYAKFDNNNNIVTVGTGWVEGANQTVTGRRRGAGFGYNGYLYVVGGYDGTAGVLADIEFAKINTSDGSWGTWAVSDVTINQRWGLSVPISNSFAYVVGGCIAGAAPGACNTRTNTTQTFQVYNNNSGAPALYSTSANTYSTNPNRTGLTGTVMNGYLYAAGGCTGTSDCTTPVSTVSYAAIDTNGALGSWSNTTAALPASRAWGKLLAAGGTLYYVGGQDGDGIAQSAIYYGTPASGNVSSWSTASNALPAARTRFGAAVWNDRLYVVGGTASTVNTVVYNAAGSGTFVVPTGVTSVTVKAWGAGGAGGNGSASTGIGGGGGGGGFAQATLAVTAGESLTYNVGTGGTANTTASYGGNAGGFSALLRSGTYLIQAGGGGGGGGTWGTAAGGQGGGGGGTSGTAGTAGAGTATVGGAGGGGTNAAGGAAGAAGTGGVAGRAGIANAGGDGGGSLTNCTTAVTGTGGNGGTGAGGKGGNVATCIGGGGGGGGRFGGGGGGSATTGTNRGAGGGGGGSDLVTGSGTTETAGSAGAAGVGGAAGNSTDADRATAGNAGNGSTGTASTAGSAGALVITYGTYTPTTTVYVSPAQSSGGNIASAWSSASTSFNVARISPTVVAYANNLYLLGGYDGTNYLSDTQFSQLNSTTGNAGSWTYSESLPIATAGGDGFGANGYVYLIGGRSSSTTCDPLTLVAPISANTTIATGNNPTGVGAWYETNQRYTGARYGNVAVYNDGKAYVYGGSCGTQATYASPVTQQTALLSQPQVAKYSIMLDTDSDVFPTHWLLNGLDNSIGARWQLKYRSATDATKPTVGGGPDGRNCSTTETMTTWGSETNFGNVTLALPGIYTPRNSSNVNTNCARFYYFNISVDSSQAFGYPDDVSRGPTITDLTLNMTADPAKRLMHGRTFTGGLQMPIDTPYYTN